MFKLTVLVSLILVVAKGIFISHLLTLSLTLCKGKVFERCELARELVNRQGFARATVGNWVCLANVI